MNDRRRVPVRRSALPVCLLAVALLWLPTLNAAAQDPESRAAASAAAAEFDVPRVGPASDTPPTLGDRIDAVLNPINSAVFTTLFFDVAFGAFQEPVLDDAGNPTFAQEPVMLELDADLEAALLDDAGNVPTDDEGEAILTVFPAGASVHQVDARGKPMFTDGAAVTDGAKLPFLVVWLALGAIFFTVYHGFINLRGFKHAIDIVRGKWAAPDDTGDISPFRALTSALSATVGLGNIAGVAIAMVIGGPGALLWMMVLGFFGMASKFHETTLSQMFRIQNKDGSMSGGPMFFLSAGLKQAYPHAPGVATIGKVLAVVFAVFLMGASLGGGNMFQA
ncbi:MAG: alanine:cation symporter family protein, partial [Planctomycetota bacterium]